MHADTAERGRARSEVESYTIDGVAYRVHPAALLFPLLDGKEREQLVGDVRKRGVREPVVIWRGQLLDGRNRVEAARQANVPVPVRQLDDDVDPFGFVLSANAFRRHMTASQLAMTCARVHEEWTRYLHGESLRRAVEEAERSGSDTGRHPAVDGPGDGPGAAATGTSRPSPRADPIPDAPGLKVLAAKMGTPYRTASRASSVRRSAPDLEAPVLDGTITVHDAHEIRLLPRPQRQRAVEAVKTGQARTARHAVGPPAREDPNLPRPQRQRTVEAVKTGRARTARHAGGRPTPEDTSTKRRAGNAGDAGPRPAPPDPPPQVAAGARDISDRTASTPSESDPSPQVAAGARDREPSPVAAGCGLPSAMLARVRDAFGGIDIAVCSSAAEREVLRAGTWQRNGDGAAESWSGKVYLRPRLDQVARCADRLLSGLDAAAVTRAALLAPTELTEPWFHRALAHEHLSVVVLEYGRRSPRPRGAAETGTSRGRTGLFVFGVSEPPPAFIEAFGTWGHVLAPWRQAPSAGIIATLKAPLKEMATALWKNIEKWTEF